MLKVVPIVLPVILIKSAGGGFLVQLAVRNIMINNSAEKMSEPLVRNLKELSDRK
jgi:hypothetical protein